MASMYIYVNPGGVHVVLLSCIIASIYFLFLMKMLHELKASDQLWILDTAAMCSIIYHGKFFK